MPVQIENLVRLLGGYFHEDWLADHATAEECLDRMLIDAPLEQRRRGAVEIAGLLNRELCENQLHDLLLYEVGCAYALETDDRDASSWLRHVRARLLESTKGGGVRGTEHE